MKHRFLYMLITFVFSAFCSAVSVTDAAVSRIERGVLRLHILANSDSESDQARKLLVRDALLARSSEWTADADSCADAAEIMQKKLPAIEQIARETLRAAGCDVPVKAAVCMDDFPPRTYESYTLPAERYQTLRIEIGEGAEKKLVVYHVPESLHPRRRADRKRPRPSGNHAVTF